MLRTEKEVPTWHGPVQVQLSVQKSGDNFVIKAKLRSNGPKERQLARALWIASRALFLTALDVMDEVGLC